MVVIKVYLPFFYSSMIFFNDSANFRHRKMALKIRILLYRVSHSKDEKVILLWWGDRFWILLIFWVLRVHEIGPFMPNSSVFIELMLRILEKRVPNVKLLSKHLLYPLCYEIPCSTLNVPSLSFLVPYFSTSKCKDSSNTFISKSFMLLYSGCFLSKKIKPVVITWLVRWTRFSKPFIFW